MQIEGRVAVVTGASSGIGAAIARDLSNAGAKVLLSARRADRIADLSRELAGESESLVADIADPDTPRRLLELAQARWGRVDIMINNAGLLAAGRVEDPGVEELTRTIRVNFEAVVRCSQIFGAAFKARGCGAIINISSIAAFNNRPLMGIYAGAKAGVEIYTAALRLELSPHGVKVGSLAPGSTRTEMLDNLRRQRGIDLETPAAQAQDIAAAVRFMLEQPDRVNIAGMRVYSSNEIT
jgi:serine 3-dehydrogenase (NADP+)